jgi:tetratricopeptide (TPR) repeat protein
MLTVMKLILPFTIAIFALGCGNSSGPVVENSNTASAPMRAEKLQSTTVHTTENDLSPADADAARGGKWSASGNPIDTAAFDKAIEDAEKELKAKPLDAARKKVVADAYFDKGFALTEARQYASALGDYRHALKIDPEHEEAKKWEQRIIGIYGMMKKEYPKPGEEPPPLPFKS